MSFISSYRLSVLSCILSIWKAIKGFECQLLLEHKNYNHLWMDVIMSIVFPAKSFDMLILSCGRQKNQSNTICSRRIKVCFSPSIIFCLVNCVRLGSNKSLDDSRLFTLTVVISFITFSRIYLWIQEAHSHTIKLLLLSFYSFFMYVFPFMEVC